MTRAIDDLLTAAVASGDVPGVVAMAATDSGIVYQGAFGRRTLDKPEPMGFDTTLRMFSMTKAITGAAAMQLVEQGRLSLDAPIAGLLPELAAPKVLEGFDAAGQPRLRPAKGAITLRQLLTHTAGFGYETWNADIKRYQEVTGIPGLSSGKLASMNMPLTFDPGTAWEYSISIDWVGRAVEAGSGMDLETYFKRHIFAPLGMKDTVFIQSDDQRARRATVHQREADGGLRPMVLDRPDRGEFFGGGGGLFGTVPDYLAFTRALLAGGAPLVKPETMAEMARNSIGDIDVVPLRSYVPERSVLADFWPGMRQKWGLTFLINTETTPQGRAPGSLSWAGLGNLFFWIDPTRRVTGVFATQVLPFFDPRTMRVFRDFEAAVYRSL